jgi:hypothetical protein
MKQGKDRVPCVKDPKLVTGDTDSNRESKYRYKTCTLVSIAMGKRIAGKLHGPFVRADRGRQESTSSDSTLRL